MAVAEVEAATVVLRDYWRLEKVGCGRSCHGTISPDRVACCLSLATSQKRLWPRALSVNQKIV